MRQPYFLNLRAAWANHILKDKPVPANLLGNPLSNAYPISEALAYLLSRSKGKPFPGFETKNLSIGELCQLAILKSLAGGDGESLARSIFPLCSFPFFCSRESSFHLQDTQCAIALLLKAFGKEAVLPPTADPFFYALEKKLPSWTEEVSAETSLGSIHKAEGFQGAFALLGDGIPVGSIHASKVAIPAFGPHVYPFSDSKFFGMHKSEPNDRWAAVSAKREVWFEVIPDWNKKILETRFIGLKASDPLFFSFYIKADFARIDSEVYIPKNLRRFSGSAKHVIFEREESRLTISNAISSKMELIPLASSGCFWDSDFLLAFEIPFHEGRGIFQFEIS